MNKLFEKIFIKSKWIGAIFLVFGLIGVIYTFLESDEFTASSKLIIIQNHQSGTDPYLLSGASKYLGLIFVEIIKTNSFAEKVVLSSEQIDKNFFQLENKDQAIKKWNRAVNVKLVSDTGIIEIKVRHHDREQALFLTQGIAGYLANNHSDFHGAGDQIQVKTIDQSAVNQTRPDLFFNLIIAGGLAFLVSIWWSGGFSWFFQD